MVSNGTDITPQNERLFSGKNARLVPAIASEHATGKHALRSYATKDAKPNVGNGDSSNLFWSINDVGNWLALDSLLWVICLSLVLRKMERLRLRHRLPTG
jgi:hypothetical protein